MSDSSKSARRRLPSGLELLGDPVFIFDRAGEIVAYNGRVTELLGGDPESLSTVNGAVQLLDSSKPLEAVTAETRTVSAAISTAAGDQRLFELRLTELPEEEHGAVLAVGRELEPEESGRQDSSERGQPAGGAHTLVSRERVLRRVYDVIADDERDLRSKIDDLLGIVREALGAEFGTLSRIDGDSYTVEALRSGSGESLRGPDGVIEEGDAVPLSMTNCERVIETGESLALDEIERDAPELAERQINAEMGISCYLGAPVSVNGEPYGTFCLYDTEPRDTPFSEWEMTLVELLGSWVGYELEREWLIERVRTEGRQRYETLVEQSRDAIVVVQDGEYVFVNDRFVELTGRDRGELLGTPFEQVVVPESRELVKRRYEQRVAGEAPTDRYDVEIETPDGTTRTLALAASQITHDGTPATLATLRDVTARKRHERAVEALQEGVQRLQRAQTHDAVALATTEVASEVLDRPLAACWLLDADGAVLEPAAATESAREAGLFEPIEPGTDGYDAVRDGAVTRFDGDIAGVDHASGVLLPVGNHGLVAAGQPGPASHDDLLLDVARTLTEYVKNALNRIEQTQTLKRARDRFEAVFDNTYQFTGLMDTDGTLVEANETALEFGDLDREDVVGEKLWDAYWFGHDEQLREQVRAAVDTAAAGEFVRQEVTVQGSDREAVIDFSVRPITDDSGAVTLLIPEGRDITELNEREEELRRERDHVRRTEALADVGGWELNVETGAMRWTDGVRQLHDLEDSFEPTWESAKGFLHSEDREAVTAAVESCHETGEPVDVEARIVTDAGRTRWLRIEGERITDEETTELRGVMADITERREREQRLMVLNRVLRHNLRNKLSVISAYAATIESDLDVSPSETDLPVERAGEQLEQIQASATELVELGEKAREFEQIIDDSDPTGAVDVEPVIEQVAADYRKQHPTADITASGADLSVRSSGETLRFAVEELVANAIKHSDRARPTVEIRAEQTQNGQVAVSVADDGPGIPESERETLTEGEESALLHGSGLGLWTVNWVTSRLSGTVTISERDPRGTVVTLALPATEE